MAIIAFTQADALQSVMLEAGNYSAEIVEIDGPKASTSQKSLNFYATFRITSGAYEGKELKVAYNTGMDNTSLLNMQYSPHTDLLKIEAAINKTKVEPKLRSDFDTDNLLHKPITIVVAPSANKEGGLGLLITGYLPAGIASNIPF